MGRKRVQSSIVTVVPTHTAELTEIEWRRVHQTVQLAGQVFFAVPEELDTSIFAARLGPTVKFEFFPSRHFNSHESYNRWLLEPEFYKRFAEFEFLLISQTDALLIRDPGQLPRNYDYIGAPWDPGWRLGWEPRNRTLVPQGGIFQKLLRVGNGGLSLPKISSFSRLVGRIPKFRTFTHEDAMISYFGPLVGLRIAPPDVARGVFMESSAKQIAAGSKMPSVFGFHDLAQFNPTLEARLLDG